MTKIQTIKDFVMSRKFIIPVMLIVVSIVGFSIYRSIYKTGYLTLANPNPYQVVVAIRYQTNESEFVTEGWWTLKPGEQVSLNRSFTNIKPNFAVYSQSDEPQTVRFLYNLPDETPATIYFEGDRDDPVTFQNVLSPSKKMEIRSRIGADTVQRTGMELAAFVNVPVNNSYLATRLIHDPNLKGVLDDGRIPTTEEEIGTILARAILLAKSLPRQQSYFKKFPNPAKSYPFDTGLRLEDQNGLDKPGITVVNVDILQDLNGNKMPFKNGDIIYEFAGQTVFSNSDLLMLLFDHGSSKEKGIEVPIDFKVYRGNDVVIGKTTYFFNKEFWGEQSKLTAFGVGFGDSVTFGNEAAAEVVTENVITAIGNIFRDKNNQEAYPDYSERRWQKAQRNARLKNFEPGYYDAGSIAGLFFPSAPRLIFQKVLARQITRKVGSRIIGNVLSAATLEVAEGVMWTVGNSSLESAPENLAVNISKGVLTNAAVGVITGALKRRIRRPAY